MAEYIEREDLIKRLELRIKSWSADCNSNAGKMVLAYQEILHEVKNIHTADVVPKSEVEMLQGALKAEELHNELTMEMAQKALANAKAEVAMEIFAKIDNLIKCNERDCGRLGNVFKHDIAELKKKYTEGKT